MTTSEMNPRESGSRRLLNAAETRVGLVSAVLPPNLIDKLLGYLSDRFKKPASQRVRRQAMIVSPVRIQHLIALLPRQSIDSDNAGHPLRSLGYRLSHVGFFEDDLHASDNGIEPWRGSARKAPQLYGKNTALLFDIEGLIGWLRAKYPRSTMHHIAADTGIPAPSIENWLHRRSQPSVEHFMILLATFGPALLHACLRHKQGWVEHAAKQARAREIDEEIARLQGERRQVVAG